MVWSSGDKWVGMEWVLVVVVEDRGEDEWG